MDGCAKLLYKKAISSRRGDGNGKEGIILKNKGIACTCACIYDDVWNGHDGAGR